MRPAPKQKLKKLLAQFEAHKKKIRARAFSQLPWQKIHLPAQKSAERCDVIVLVGMGGASLGAKTIAEAMAPLPKPIIFFDNIDPDSVAEKLSTLKSLTPFFIIASKSGETVEALSLLHILSSHFKLSAANCLCISDTQENTLGSYVRTTTLSFARSRSNVPGRFSVLSELSLVPLHFAGIKIDDLHTGAQKVSFYKAYELACAQYVHYKEGKNISVFFYYGEKLRCFALWYSQLLAESIGKSKKIGITPVVAQGAQDQHSQLQLFLDGPDDKFYLFIKPENFAHNFGLPAPADNLQRLFAAEYKGTQDALKKYKKPLYELSAPRIDLRTLGSLFFFFELQVAFLGSLFNIEFENQPAVELSKKLARNILERSK